jgi:hypothetical protein
MAVVGELLKARFLYVVFVEPFTGRRRLLVCVLQTRSTVVAYFDMAAVEHRDAKK